MRAIMEKIKRRGENYTIPQIDLSVEPKNTKEEFKYLYENVTVEKKGGYLGHPDSVLLKDGSILVFSRRVTAREKLFQKSAATAAEAIPRKSKIRRKAGKIRARLRRFIALSSPRATHPTS